ncbi:hypothetical protein [Shewanella sp. AS16]|uniref:hypothetical protein n=1 Tax=Shewanella sp. AS16 TaxID=2907625 RepID=UPI003FA362D6
MAHTFQVNSSDLKPSQDGTKAQNVLAVLSPLHGPIAALCGQAFEGRVVSNDSADKDMAQQRLVMHVRECTETELKVPFHVGEDSSRTWVISKTANGLQLKHDHRHKDGSPDAVTFYGGETLPGDLGSPIAQSFPVDAESIESFNANGLAKSVTNVWHLYLSPQMFTYRLSREDREFRVDFDLRNPVTTPAAPWGH